MKTAHALILSLAIGVAAGAGTFAALRTTALGARSAAAPAATAAHPVRFAAVNRSLDRAQAALRRQLASRPPALPPLPRVSAAPTQPVRAMYAAAAPRTVYVRPKPIIRVLHRHGGEHEGGDAQGDGGGGNGASFDD